MTLRTADNEGRVTLGERFANRMVIVHEVDETEVHVTLARAVPEREAWLFENAAARQSVLCGLGQAKDGRLVDPPARPDENLLRQLDGEA